MCSEYKNGKCTSEHCFHDTEKMVCCLVCSGRMYCVDYCHGDENVVELKVERTV